MFANLIANRVLFGTLCNDPSVWEAFAAELLRHNGHPKEFLHVSIDIRHERRLRQGRQRQPWEYSGDVRQVTLHPECGGGVPPDPEGREMCQRRETGPSGADALYVAQEPGELDGEGSPKMGVDGSGTMREGYGLRDEAGASGHTYERKDAVEAWRLFRN